MATELEYNGKPMRFEPHNMTTDKLVKGLLTGKQIVVDLQPGDDTRYMLDITPMGFGGVLRVRLTNMRVPGMEYINVRNMAESSFDRLDTNSWTQTFLRWWFSRLGELMTE